MLMAPASVATTTINKEAKATSIKGTKGRRGSMTRSKLPAAKLSAASKCSDDSSDLRKEELSRCVSVERQGGSAVGDGVEACPEDSGGLPPLALKSTDQPE